MLSDPDFEEYMPNFEYSSSSLLELDRVVMFLVQVLLT